MQVMSTKSGASLHLPLILMSLANGILFTLYGLAISDEYVVLPNIIGACLSTVQLCMKLYYDSSPKFRLLSSEQL